MDVTKIIQQEYKHIIKESINYNNINFNDINTMNDLTVSFKYIYNNLVSLSKLIINLPEEKRLDLTSVPDMIEFISTIKKDIDIAMEKYDEYEQSDAVNSDEFSDLDSIQLKCTFIYDDIDSFLDELDTEINNIKDHFDDFIDSVRKHIR